MIFPTLMAPLLCQMKELLLTPVLDTVLLQEEWEEEDLGEQEDHQEDPEEGHPQEEVLQEDPQEDESRDRRTLLM